MNKMEKKIYKKPEMDVLSLNIKDSVLENRRWTVDGNKEGNVEEGPEGGIPSLLSCPGRLLGFIPGFIL